MSVIIKSNNVATKAFGTAKMLGTTALAEFTKYKARVIADGGVVKDDAKTLSAFELLFNTKMYGNMNSFVSGHFGVKASGSSINKLYAIDGVDMLGTVFGAGTLPTLDVGNIVSFTANDLSQKVNIGMFVSESKVVPYRSAARGFLVRVTDAGVSTATHKLCGLSLVGNTANSSPLEDLVMASSSEITWSGQNSPLKLSGATGSAGGAGSDFVASPIVNVKSYNYPTACFLTDPNANKIYGYCVPNPRAPATGTSFVEGLSYKFDLTFGGTVNNNTRNGAACKVSFFAQMGHATKEQAEKLSAFII